MESPGLEALVERDLCSAETPRQGRSSSYLQHRHSRSAITTYGDVTDMSPRLSHHVPTINREKIFHQRYSLNLPEHFPENHIITATERTERTISKSVADLVWEIAVLEEEVVRKELHLLSLYRAALDPYLGISPRSSAQVDQELHRQCSRKKADEGALRLRDIKESASYNLPTLSDSKRYTQELSRSSSGRSSLANFLSASITEYVPKISCKLSEDILRCISAVYCKLANGNYDYPGMIIFSRIHIDQDKFEYASKMLDTIRTLIKRLERIDPTKMAREEQICFWINIHNALVMHAFMAYGLQEKRMKNTDMILKAAYNVGGHSVNSQIIQSSILGCQTHRPSLWVRTLFAPAKKSELGGSNHPYALHPEPLAHFALSTGAYSDPPVRLYTAKKIYHQLEQARTEFIQANFMVRKQIIFLPKVLHYYGKDAALELPGLIEMVCQSMTEVQQKEIRQYLKRRIDKCVEWLPYKSSFRYTLHRSLAE